MVMAPRSEIPGSRFDPKEMVLIDHFLRKKNENGKSWSFITEKDVYEKEPWLLQHVRHFRSKTNVWFYFVTRKTPAGTKKAEPKNTSRRAGQGTWKTCGKLEHIYKNKVEVGTKQLISYKYNKETTGWVMHEFILHQSKKGYQENVLCRIKFEPGKDNTLNRFAPILQSIVIGQPPPPQPNLAEEENQNSRDVLHVAAAEDIQYSNAPFQTQQGIELQHQGFGSYGQPYGAHQQNDILGLVEAHQQYYHGNMFWRQETDPSHSGAQAMGEQQWINEYSAGSYSAQPYDPSQLQMALQERNILTAQHQQLSLEQQRNQIIGQATNLSSQLPYHQYFGQNNDLSVVPMEIYNNLLRQHNGYGNMVEYHNQIIWRQEKTDPSLSAQAMAEHQQIGPSGPYLAQPYDQNHHNVECIKENDDDVNYLINLDHDDLISLISFEDLPEDPFDISEVLMETQQQDNVVGNLAAQLQLEEQDNVPLMTLNQTTEPPHLTQQQEQPWSLWFVEEPLLTSN